VLGLAARGRMFGIQWLVDPMRQGSAKYSRRRTLFVLVIGAEFL
jgi:hypothetical protein